MSCYIYIANIDIGLFPYLNLYATWQESTRISHKSRRQLSNYDYYRADYWKSQSRKFCDFCKCWIADNKPSIDFHEGGKKHKENVSKRLKEIHKNSAKQMKQNKKFEHDIKKMENVYVILWMSLWMNCQLKHKSIKYWW